MYNFYGSIEYTVQGNGDYMKCDFFSKITMQTANLHKKVN